MHEQPTQSFERIIARLDEIVQRLEAGGADLDESVTLFREGKELAARCEALLRSAEETIARLADVDVAG